MDAQALGVSLSLGVATLAVLLPLGTWAGHALAVHRFRGKSIVEALVALPLVLPPTVLGFYLLVVLSPAAPLGAFWVSVTGDALTFSFTGLVVASVIYSLPFTVQPLESAFESVGRGPIEAAASLGASPFDAFLNVVLPMSARGFITAAVLTFTHTLGEFGVVLMVGGNIPGETRVVSIAIYEHFETLNYADAHVLAGVLLVFSFLVLLIVYGSNRRNPLHVR
jgi:molybdate transport system permease protein